jgi:uncharacterized repeat protein (TIGR03803 family)
MKKNLYFCILVIHLFLFSTTKTIAQLTVLHNFTSQPDGAWPWGSLISDGTYLYGTTQIGGASGSGTVFRIKPDGSGYGLVYDFVDALDGAYPLGDLLYDGTYLYAMTATGGANAGSGVIFKVKPDGTGFLKIFDFDAPTTGNYPSGSLISDGTFLYGMTQSGGAANNGTLFKILPDGSGYVKLRDFDAPEGRVPYGSLLYDGTWLYGTTDYGGNPGAGTVFKVKTDGSSYTTLLNCDGPQTGSYPVGSLISDGTYLYGTTTYGGISDSGTVFKIKPDGTGYVRLVSFSGYLTGGHPYNSLVLSNSYLYGMTRDGGINDMGVIFQVKTDGTNFVKLEDFAGASNGSYPFGSLFSDGTYLYGMPNGGGTADGGLIFRYRYLCVIPAVQATNLTFTNTTSNSVTVNWTNGNGARRIVKIKPAPPFTAPANGNDYTANSVYSGSGEQVVYNGTGNSVTVTGLLPSHWYWFRVYEASCSSTNSLYLTSAGTGNPRRVLTLPYQSPNRPEGEPEEAESGSLLLYPNPTTSSITVESSENNLIQQLTIYSMDGKLLKSIRNQESEIINIDMQELSAGIYFLDCRTENGSEKMKVVKY